MKRTITEDSKTVAVEHSNHLETVENGVQDGSFNGFTQHMEGIKSPEEAEAEKRYLRKVDFTILPLLVLTLFLASLDRGDLGYGYTAGMKEELKMTASEYSTCASMFYVGYTILELPASIFLKKITANVQLSLSLMAWGTFTTLLCVTHTWQQVLGLRLLIGCGEAFIQAAALYLTFFYKRDELATRGGIYYGMFAAAGSANGLLGYGIVSGLNGKNGWLAWRWIFFIEGIISIAYGIFIFFVLPPSPEKLPKYFTAKDKEVSLRRYREAYNVENDTKIRGSQMKKVFLDYRAWLYTLAFCMTNMSLAAFGNFLPILVKSFGFSTLHANLLTVPVWIATAFAVVLAGYISDRLKKRGVILMVCFTIASIGYIIVLTRPTAWVKFAAMFFIGCGSYPQVVLIQAWYSSNTIGYTKRATILAMSLMLGQCFSIASSQAYSDPPYYTRGNSIALSAMVVGGCTSGLLSWVFMRCNAKKETAQYTPAVSALRYMSLEEIQDDHPDFRYYT